ncbi:SET domain-containing protein [Eremomyces bilateralis CBS 781.70]|uniref:SET domain-containing protein n=1 Tax=Eremomyces bilateralis CBS 781.70 TaxID=1392243 RepID=A0A6G1G5K2_9PEZI|nr:SET domain-containing protein [Eremomyces bilateralis CBS 781.70]KAF1813298.1 SET domain-containing protein [Eremomyces bilateralis CBS 781.70]
MSQPFDEKTNAFLQWLNHCGAEVSNKIELQDLRQFKEGRGVVATAEIEEGETLFRIPRSLVLTAENSKLVQDHRAVIEDFNDEPWAMLILAMTYEYFRGRDSPWFPYLSILPTEFNTLMYWSDHELAELRGSTVLQRIGKKQADEDFLGRMIPLMLQHAEVFFNVQPGEPIPMMPDHLLALLHQFASTIMAYAFDLASPETGEADEDGYVSDPDEADCPKGLVPMADMLNADADRNNANLMSEPDFLEMKAIKPIVRGEQIFNDYGPLPRSELLRRYGYITDNYAIHDVVEIPSDVIIAAFHTLRPGTAMHQDVLGLVSSRLHPKKTPN